MTFKKHVDNTIDAVIDTFLYNHNFKTLPLDIGKKTIDWLIKASGDAKQVSISFFGGEPLLAIDLIKQLVAYGETIKEKRVKFGITTNGTLIFIKGS